MEQILRNLNDASRETHFSQYLLKVLKINIFELNFS
jgi:hypothetical protein